MYHGLTSAEKYPYQDKKNDECLYDEKEDKIFSLDFFKAYEYVTIEDLKRLSCHGAVAVNVRINDCIKNYKSGIIFDGDKSCGCSAPLSTNHAAVVVGFGRDLHAPG